MNLSFSPVHSVLSKWVLFWACLWSYSAHAAFSSTIFYPLPLASHGEHLAVKKVYLNQKGGLWFHNEQGEVSFYDGVHLLPRLGSVLDTNIDDLVYGDDVFWSFDKNLIFRHIPNEPSTLAFSLDSSAIISAFGQDSGYLWLIDQDSFYSYHIESETLHTYPLSALATYSDANPSAINSVTRINETWLLATSSGLYLSHDRGFSLLLKSKGLEVTSSYYSAKRSELLVGSHDSVFAVDIESRSHRLLVKTGSKVTAFIETDVDYWFGTNEGIVTSSFVDGKVSRYLSDPIDPFSIPSNKVLSLVNDQNGGVWVTTDRGVVYHSLFSTAYTRLSSLNQSFETPISRIHQLIPFQSSDFLVATNIGLLQFHKGALTRVVRGEVTSAIADENRIWAVRSDNIVTYDRISERIAIKSYKSLGVDALRHIARSDSGEIWAVSDHHLYLLADNNSGQLEVIGQYSLPKQYQIKALFVQGDEIYLTTNEGIAYYKKGRFEFLDTPSALGPIASVYVDTNNEWLIGNHSMVRTPRGAASYQEVPTVELKTRPVCLVKSDYSYWLATSKGLSVYSESAVPTGHFSAPYGLINNEFTHSTCAISDDDSGILLASKRGLVYASLSDLTQKVLPQSKVLISQVSVDSEPIAIGPVSGRSLMIPYDSTLTFLFGSLPDFDPNRLEFRLTSKNDDPWTLLQSAQLTFDSLQPGRYELEIRVVSRLPQGLPSTVVQFEVEQPWYLTAWFIVTSVFVFAFFTLLAVMWRSRKVVRLNQQLKEQVSLKTLQLQHQSRVLLASNQQLRRQFYARHLLFNRVLESSREAHKNYFYLMESNPEWHNHYHRDAIKAIEGVEFLMGVGTNPTVDYSHYDLIAIIDAIMESWQNELSKFGMSLEVIVKTEFSYVKAGTYNFDFIFDAIISNALQRSYRSNVLSIIITDNSNSIVVQFIDVGRAFDLQKEKDEQLHDLSVLGSIENHVNQSGGSVSLRRIEGRNVVEVAWPKVESEKVHDALKLRLDNRSKEQKSLVDRNLWINKVKTLIEEHYADSHFGTNMIADKLFMSERSFQRKFKQVTNRTFKEYLIEFRLDRACALLVEGTKVGDVAFSCGFNDPSYFTQKFKVQFGVTPSQFISSIWK